MALCQQRDQQMLDGVGLPDNSLGDFAADGLGQMADIIKG